MISLLGRSHALVSSARDLFGGLYQVPSPDKTGCRQKTKDPGGLKFLISTLMLRASWYTKMLVRTAPQRYAYYLPIASSFIPVQGGWPMSWLLRSCIVAGVLAALAVPHRTAAQDAVRPKEVQEAIDKGANYLKRIGANGTWTHRDKGATPLAAWTLLECGVSPNDPLIKKAAENTRLFIPSCDKTYDIALAIMLFDKLGDPEDEALIEVLALQLLGGQNGTFGWSYYCPGPSLKDAARLKEHYAKLAKARPRLLPELQTKPVVKAPRDPAKVHPDVLAAVEVLNKKLPAAIFLGDIAGSDNSNTQFALMGLWIARRHGMPVEKALERVELRFRTTVQKWGWGYWPQVAQPNDKPGFQVPSYAPNATMTSVGLISLAMGNGVAAPGTRSNDLNADPLVRDNLVIVSASIGDVGQPKDSLEVQKNSKSYYFLWTLERMAVIYGLKTIAGKDWHRWGVELLRANQKQDGSWQGEYSEGGCDTCFALLFLAKANVAGDLTTKLKDKVKDPGKVAEDLLDKIGQEVKPGIDKPPPKKNSPLPETNRAPVPPEERRACLIRPRHPGGIIYGVESCPLSNLLMCVNLDQKNALTIANRFCCGC
jgi:hypothetical protein